MEARMNWMDESLNHWESPETDRIISPFVDNPSLNTYLERVQEAATLDRITENQVAQEIRELEARRWLVLFENSQGRLRRLVTEALLTQLEADDKKAVKACLSMFYQRLDLTRDLAGYDEDLAKAGGLVLEMIQTCDTNHIMFAPVFARINREPNLESWLDADVIWTLEKLNACIEGLSHRLIVANLCQVVVMARRYDFGLMPLADLVQEGNLGLIEAVRRFDHTRNVRLKTYASLFIKHRMRKALAHKGRTVRIPSGVIDGQYRIRQAVSAFETRHGRLPNEGELAAALGLSEEALARQLSHPVLKRVPLDCTPEGGGIGELEDDSLRQPDEMILLERWRREMSRVLSVLNLNERRIIAWRFGLDGADIRSFRQIGKQFGLSGERIRQIHVQALQKLRQAFCPELFDNVLETSF